MQPYLRNAPARRLTYCKSAVFKLGFVALVAIGMLAFTHAAYAFTLKFDQSAYSGNVWVQIEKPLAFNFNATYANGTKSIDFTDGGVTVLMSKPVKLSHIGAGGLNITFSQSAVFYVYYDDPTDNDRTAAPAFMVSPQRFQSFELTMMGGSGDQGNLTAINYFTAPLSIRSYDIHNNLLQQTGFGSATAAQIGARFAAATGGNPNAVVKDANGKIVRYLGPSNGFTGTNPWPSFIPYTKSIHAAKQQTHIKRSNGFNFAAPDNIPVYQFGADMTATANANGSLTITGSITVSVNAPIKPNNPSLPPDGQWTGATFSFSVSDTNAFNNAVYGQTAPLDNKGAVIFTGQAWSDFKTFTQATRKDPSQPHNPSTNPSLYDLGAYDTTLRMFIGEVTTGLLGGFFNSDYQVGGVALKNMYSNQWWSLNPMVAYSEIQPLHPFYNLYAAVIFDESHNTVYGVPYSDRFGTGPLVNTVSFNGTEVNYWVLGVGAPLPGTKALPGIMMLLLGNQ
ncbi:MAG: hypothetical protein FJ134_14755 [Deltaproteobacteria bacterium]|nr:hypothetical protein [Deltaproteobacteria bacterium]